MAHGTGHGIHIHYLPDDCMNIVMNYLPLSDRKSTSLVCRHWSLLSFSHYNLNKVRLIIKEQGLDQKVAVVNVLMKSWRTYQDVSVDFGCSPNDMVLVCAILNKFARSIEIFASQTLYTAMQLKEVLEKMPNLKRLVVNTTHIVEPHLNPPVFPILSNLVDIRSTDTIFKVLGNHAAKVMPKVRNISVFFRGNVAGESFQALEVLSPKLKSLEMFAELNDAPMERLDLRCLVTLKIWGNNTNLNNESLRQLFKRAPLLDVLFFHIKMSDSLLDAICNNCPRLATFGFSADGLDYMSLCVLEKLKNLKGIVIDGCLKPLMIAGCKPMPSIETLCLYWHKKPLDHETFAKQLHSMMPGVRTIKILGNRKKEMDNTLLSYIGKLFTRVNRLTVADFHFSNQTQLSGVDFDWLGDLVNVNQLTLFSMRLTRFRSRRQCPVRWLYLEHFDRLLGDSLLLVASIFPRLSYLEINRCPLITCSDVAMAQRAMPNCVIKVIVQNTSSQPVAVHVK